MTEIPKDFNNPNFLSSEPKPDSRVNPVAQVVRTDNNPREKTLNERVGDVVELSEEAQRALKKSNET